MSSGGGNPFTSLSGTSAKLVLTLAGVGIALLISIPVLLWTVRMVENTLGSSSFYSKNTTTTRTTPTGAATTVPHGAEFAARDFLNDISAGQLNLAYQRTTNVFKNRLTLPEFQVTVEKLAPGFLGGSIRRLNPLSTAPHRISYEGMMEGPRGSASFVLDVVYEGTEWRVDGLELNR